VRSFWEQIKKKWYVFLISGFIWLFWQLLTDEFIEKVRIYIPNGGLIIYGITHPYIIMPILLTLFSSYLFFQSKRAIKSNSDTTVQGNSIVQKVRFSQSDAWELYEKFNESIRELRKEAKNIHKDNPGLTFFEDQRYLKIMDDISKAREKCTDKTLNDLLNKLLEYELHCAEFGFSPIESPYSAGLENYHQRIRDINKHIRE
jgi:hypothetical protein